MADPDEEQNLALDIAYALWRSPLATQRRPDEEMRLTLARRIIRHLKLCAWEFTKRPPAKPH